MAKNQTYYKCAYPHCKHDDRKVHRDEAVKVGNRYWHPDCLAEHNTIKEIENVWIKRIDENPVLSNLRGQINTLVFKQGNDAEYLLFALNYCLDNGWNLNYPAGLRYVVKDVNAKKEWDRIHKKQIKKETDKNIQEAMIINGETDYNATPIVNVNKRKGFGLILGR